MADQEQVTTGTAATGSPWVWVYRALALTGIAVGISSSPPGSGCCSHPRAGTTPARTLVPPWKPT